MSTICFVAGHSGGHIIPCLTLAAQMQKEHKKKILFFSSSKPLDTNMIHASSVMLTQVTLPIAQQRHWYTVPLLALGILVSFVRSAAWLLRYMPDKIITTGSIVAIPVCIAGYLLGIPIELYELNAVPGKTIRVLSALSDTISVCFANTIKQFPHKKCILKPYPIRFSVSPYQHPSFDSFDTQRITLFIQGGSQGSQGINRAVKAAIEQSSQLAQQIQVIHQTGEAPQQWELFYQRHHIPAHVFAFDPHLAPYYAAADVIICRSGAGALFESLYFKKKCITMPLESLAYNHQVANAQAMKKEHPSYFEVTRTQQQLMNAVSQLGTMDSLKSI